MTAIINILLLAIDNDFESITEISKKLNLTVSHTSKTVNDLISKGYLKKTRKGNFQKISYTNKPIRLEDLTDTFKK